MKKKLSLTEKISLAENNAVDFMHACVTIALHDEYEVGVQRLRKVNLRRDAINEEMLEVMAQPRKSGREQAAAGQAWLVSLLPEGAETEFRVPLGKGAARKQKELQIRMAVDNAATLEWRVYAAACAEVLGFGAKRLNDLHKAVLENFRQLSAWAIEDGVDVALERFCRCARDAYKTDVQVEDIPDAQALHQQQRHKKVRQAVADEAEKPQNIVCKFIVLHRRPDAQRNGNDHGRPDGERRQQQRRRELGHKRPEHVLPGNIADAHIAGQQPSQPCAILRQKGLVKPQLRPLGVDDLLGHRPLVAVQLGDGVTSGQAHHGEGQKRDAQQHRDQLQKALAYIFVQNGYPL